MDCPICYKKIINSCIGSCTHHFCLTCLIKWCEHGGRTCPICKIPIREIRLDTEFNELNSPGEVNTPYINSDNEIIVDFNKNDLAGLTLENNFTVGGFKNRGPGVKISKINKKDKCYISGLRINDILLFIKGVENADTCYDNANSSW